MKPIKERLEQAEAIGRNRGITEGFELSQRQITTEHQIARSGIMKAAAELAQANAKLTYAMSRMIAEKGW